MGRAKTSTLGLGWVTCGDCQGLDRKLAWPMERGVRNASSRSLP